MTIYPKSPPMNPWKTIALDDYEGHMATPTVGQAAMLAEELGNALAITRPKRMALLGCAGGNGLEQTIALDLETIICVDINPNYIAQLETRYKARIPQLACYVSEVEQFRTSTIVDLVFGGLIFEYTRLPEAITTIAQLLGDGGEFFALLQLPADSLATVTPSPYAEALSVVMGFFQYVEPATLIAQAALQGLRLQHQKVVTLDSGKSFAVLRFQKSCPKSLA
jgi:hypothetical protein